MGRETHDTSRRTILKGSALGAGALIGAAALPASAKAAAPAALPEALGTPGPDSYFMKIKTTTIPLTSFSFGASRAASEGRAGRKAASPTQIHFHAPTTVSSPNLMRYMVVGQVLPAVQLSAVRGSGAIKGEASVTFLKVDLSDVVVSSYEFSAPFDDVPGDSGTLSYGKITYSYYPQNPDGQLGVPTTLVWDTRTDKVV